ncbi:MAG: DNA repair protein RecO [Gammaproteobacteria bacterium]|nr:DNA repair protein RecO [Gammaproteobacteria bacterium]MCP4088789.1 DNA repair protein RecO [Gammaproteobacteria bacterium]MCP4275912.1 DNA repair protein RecO [Gammaproteobacteria bacterium]MCP4832128.1 DNA repair protein RecO [Gammaproteobacteria bacterium]MCP4928271.1 DNA repair protein RecO [Gammaproteobacteria bacterium]
MSNSSRIDLNPAYVLHTRAYRETSQILDIFSADYGRVGLIARGARRPKSSLRGVLNPFQPLRLSWSGRGELATLREADLGGLAAVLTGDRLMAGFYVNELLLKLLGRNDPHPDLFAHYISLIAGIGSGEPLEPMLRRFELQLLSELGYAINLDNDALTHKPLVPDQYYEFHTEVGLVPAVEPQSDGLVFPGATLLAIGRMQFEDEDCLHAAKCLLRSVLNYHLGGKGLQTRRVAAAMKRT